MWSCKLCKFILPILMLYLILYDYEGYQNNKPPSDRPDSMQFMACHDNSTSDHLANNNYKSVNHKLGKPLVGVYSKFIDKYDIRNYDEFFHAPICENEDIYNFEGVQSLDFREIYEIGDDGDIYKEEIDLDKQSIRSPNYVYVNPEYIGNKLLYDSDTNARFLKSHKTHDTKTLQHRMDASLYGNDI